MPVKKPPPDTKPTFDVSLPPDGGLPARQFGENINKLETDLQEEKDQRKEERFYWIFVCILAVDAMLLLGGVNWFGFLVFCLFQFVFLMIMAHRLGVDWAVKRLGDLYQHLKRNSP